jgi:nucleotide-binding universal stress UspA family protein
LNNLSRILVALDGSEGADKAFNAAAELTRKFDAKLFAICVVELPSTLGIEKEFVRTLETALQRQARQLLSDYSAKAKTNYGIEIEIILASGYPSRAIVDMAKSKDIDFIVIGTRGMSGIKSLILGSVSQDVVRGAKQPVLVVK